MAGEVCKLGAFTFPLAPEREIDIDNNREVAKIDIPGAGPKYQDMGKGERTITWSGALTGSNALLDSNKIQIEMHKGTPLAFSYGPLRTTVRIKNFKKQVRRFDYIRYTIELVEDPPEVKQAIVAPAATRVLSTASKKPTSQAKAKAKPKSVKIKQGETLSILAKRYNTTWQTLAKMNHITNPRKIPVGKEILLP
jgi:LysM repeat protein